jgi:hypothetical protein
MIVHEAPENAQTHSALFMHFIRILRFFPSAEYTSHNILLAEEVGQCPLTSSRLDIVVDRAGVLPLAGQNVLSFTGSDDSEQFLRVMRKCHQSVHM